MPAARQREAAIAVSVDGLVRADLAPGHRHKLVEVPVRAAQTLSGLRGAPRAHPRVFEAYSDSEIRSPHSGGREGEERRRHHFLTLQHGHCFDPSWNSGAEQWYTHARSPFWEIE